MVVPVLCIEEVFVLVIDDDDDDDDGYRMEGPREEGVMTAGLNELPLPPE